MYLISYIFNLKKKNMAAKEKKKKQKGNTILQNHSIGDGVDFMVLLDGAALDS